jgi:hypothetical protein
MAAATGDAGVLEKAITIEQAGVFAYTSMLAAGVLSIPVATIVTLLRDQNQQHANTLITSIKALGGTPPRKPASTADVDKVLPGLGGVHTETEMVRFAIALESASVAYYYGAQNSIQDGALMQNAASIMASAGQHLVLLRQALRQDPVPHAFETGAQ